MKDRILRIAERLIQTRGFANFSYNDIAKELGIKTSSIHYYFSTKQDLVLAIIASSMLKIEQDILVIITSGKNNQQKIIEIIDYMFSITQEDNNKMCIGGILSMDIAMFSEDVKNELRKFFIMVESGLVAILKNNDNKNCDKHYTIKQQAQLIMCLLEGGILISRIFSRTDYKDTIKASIVQIIK